MKSIRPKKIIKIKTIQINGTRKKSRRIKATQLKSI